MQLRKKKKKPWNTRGPTYSDLRNVQILQNILDTVWQMNRGKGTGTMLLLSETGSLIVMLSQMVLMKPSLF